MTHQPEHTDVDRNGLEILSDHRCFELLETEWLGRIGLTVGGLPAILPVSYAVDGRSVVFRSVQGSKLQTIGRGDVVCFQVDHADRETGDGWSVLVVGRAIEVTDPIGRAHIDALGIDHWPPMDATHYIRLTAEVISGRRISDGVTA